MKAHLEALRRDLERPGRVGLYVAGISAALTAMVREHPELEPLIARQAEQWHDALAEGPTPGGGPASGELLTAPVVRYGALPETL